MKKVDVAIIGGGPAGLAAALELYKNGIKDIIIIERESHLGGILRQCIHDGFGLTRFKESLSGPEYADRFIKEVKELNIPYITDSTVLKITQDKKVFVANKNGYLEYHAKALILAMGCRERTRGAISIPGQRPAGIYTAGLAQAYINLQNRMVGKEVVILGSGDIGMIMARRLTLEGANVKAVFEIQPYPSGLARNIQQCLHDYDIPLYLSHSIIDVKGEDRLESVTVAKVDENFNVIEGTEQEYKCDTLILSVGLIPENELSLGAGVILDESTKGAIVNENHMTNIDGIFSAGNVLHVHDLVDFVSLEAESLADSVKNYLGNDSISISNLKINSNENIIQMVPKNFSGTKDFTLFFRPKKPIENCTLKISQGDRLIKEKKYIKTNPAEMEQIIIQAKDLNTEESLEVRIV